MKTFISIALLLTLLYFPISTIYDANAQPICSPNSIEQITDEPDGFSENPSPSSNGGFIAFQSDADINGGYPEGNSEIDIYNKTTGAII